MQNDLLTSLTEVPVGPGLAKAPTEIPGLDQITGGGLPSGRVTLVTGSAGAGKTLLGLEFLVAGARKYREPGVLVTFEESAAKVAANVRSLGFDLERSRCCSERSATSQSCGRRSAGSRAGSRTGASLPS